MKTLLPICIGCFIAAITQAQIIHVPADYPTIQQGIDAANDVDTIVLVSDGTYYEQINFLGKKPLMVASEFLMDGDTNHIANTIIDGSQAADPNNSSVVYFISGEDTTTVFCGFTVQNGKGTYEPVVMQMKMGGGIWIKGSGAKIINNRITGNTVNDTLPGSGEGAYGAGIATIWEQSNNWVVIENNIIDNNSAFSENNQAACGGMFITYNCRIVNNMISENTCISTATTSNKGGYCGGIGNVAMPSWTPNIINIIQGNIIKNNTIQGWEAYGGGVFLRNVQAVFSNNEVSSNNVTSTFNTWLGGGGGIVFSQMKEGTVVNNNLIKENICNLFGGGIYIEKYNSNTAAAVIFENNYFIDNQANYGGAFSTYDITVTLQNNVFSGNHANNQGGALYLWNSAAAINDHLASLINNSFSSNTADMMGGAIYSILAKPLIFNSIFWNDSAASGSEIYSNLPTDTVEIGFSAIDLNAIQGGGFTINGLGNINEDPLFEDFELLTISENSPCLNTGIEEYTCHYGDLHSPPTYDILGNLRPLNGNFEMGAYEELQGQVIRVPADYPTIQQGINAANNGATVLVSDGIYYEQINFLGKKPLMVASEFLMDGDTNHIANTIIDGSQLTNLDSASVVYFISGEDTTSILCGFTIQHGKGTYYIQNSGYTCRAGGGVFISASGAKIIDNHITENHLSDTLSGTAQIVGGAGICSDWIMDDHWVVIDNNVIDHNSTYSEGIESSAAGIGVWYNSRITHNIISDNTSTAKSGSSAIGAGFLCSNDPSWTNPVTAIVQHNVIINNLCEAQNGYGLGGGGYFQSVTGIFSDNYVANNSITGEYLVYGGGGLYLWQPDPGFVISNNVFKENVSDHYAGAIGMRNNAFLDNPVLVENNYFIDNAAKNAGALSTITVPVTLQNNVFSGNQADDNGGALYLWGNSVALNEHFATLINNSFYGNTATMNGGAILSYLAKPMIFNSIFWNDNANNGQEIFLQSPNDTVEIAFSTIDLSAIQGYTIDGSGNINEDPLFEDIELLTISEFSPCVNIGTEEYICHCGHLHTCPHYDIIGTYRPHGGYVDMGAYEVDFGTGIKPHAFQPASNWHLVYPNPFTDQAKLSYELDKKTQVEINLYNSSGELIQTLLSEQQEAGNQELQFSSGNLTAGIYFYRITTDSKQATGRMILMK